MGSRDHNVGLRFTSSERWFNLTFPFPRRGNGNLRKIRCLMKLIELASTLLFGNIAAFKKKLRIPKEFHSFELLGCEAQLQRL